MEPTSEGRPDTADALELARQETRAAFENRALVYYYVFQELADEIGPERAGEVMSRAIRRRGAETGTKYRAAAAALDLAEVARLFCETSPCQGALFSPGVEDSSGDQVVVRMSSCPLVDAWRSVGLSDDEIERMCDIASAVDEGTFSAAGLELTFLDKLGRPGSTRCLLQLRLPDKV